MYTQFFGLREKPFSITPDPRYLYLSQRHSDGLAHLIYGISQSGGFIQLTGEVGTGKTTLVRSLLEQLPEEADVALILNPELTTQEFLTTISEELGFGVAPQASTKSLVDNLNTYLLDAHARGRRTVLIVDEAQNLGTDILEQVRLLTNLETPRQKLLQIILIGQPELRDVLSREDMRQLAQRVTGRYHLEPLDLNDTEKYILHRMKVAGAAGGIFKKSSMREIYRWSKGIPRLINVVADRTLLAAYSHDTRNVNHKLVRRAAAEVYGDGFLSPWKRRLASVTTVAGVALLGLGLWRVLGPEINFQSDIEPAVTSTIVAAAEPTIQTSNVVGSFLVDPSVSKDTDSAFQTLFDLWGVEYSSQLGSINACEQAIELALRCWVHSGSLNQLRLLNRPAILTLTDKSGSQHHVVMRTLAEDKVDLMAGNRAFSVPLEELDNYWYGEHLLLWKPGAQTDTDLIPGMEHEGISWLRSSLARIQNEPSLNTGSSLYDAGLEARVRDYQQNRRLTIDGIVGVQTQILMNTDLALPGTPLLTRAQ